MDEEEAESRLPVAAASAWTSANTAAIKSAKLAQKVTYFQSSLSEGILEHWPLQLEQLPPFLTEMTAFTTELVELRKRHAQEVTQLALKHMALERDRMNVTSDALRSAATLITENYLGADEAGTLLRQAREAHTKILKRETDQERLSMDLRRQGVERTQPTSSDIIDPIKTYFHKHKIVSQEVSWSIQESTDDQEEKSRPIAWSNGQV